MRDFISMFRRLHVQKSFSVPGKSLAAARNFLARDGRKNFQKSPIKCIFLGLDAG
jgi:hypothetical protein